jgi:hypothetical protein
MEHLSILELIRCAFEKMPQAGVIHQAEDIEALEAIGWVLKEISDMEPCKSALTQRLKEALSRCDPSHYKYRTNYRSLRKI